MGAEATAKAQVTSSDQPSGAANHAPAEDVSVKVEKTDGTSPSTEGLKPVATLSVGDQKASKNSKETIEKAREGVEKTDSHTVSIPAKKRVQNDPPPSPPARVVPVPVNSYDEGPSQPRQVERAFNSLVDGNFRQSTFQQSHFQPTSYDSRSYSPPIASESPSSPSISSLARYVLDAFDVHNMGHTKSAILVKDRDGKILRKIDLDEGNSRLTVDLAPGDYTFEAVAGQRRPGNPDPKGDDLDNFTVKIYEDGPQKPMSPNEHDAASAEKKALPPPKGNGPAKNQGNKKDQPSLNESSYEELIQSAKEKIARDMADPKCTDYDDPKDRPALEGIGFTHA
jgi:hypothetical protein